MMPGRCGDPNAWPTSWMWALANETRFPHRTAFAVAVADFVAGGSCVRETGWNLFEEARSGVGEVAALGV